MFSTDHLVFALAVWARFAVVNGFNVPSTSRTLKNTVGASTELYNLNKKVLDGFTDPTDEEQKKTTSEVRPGVSVKSRPMMSLDEKTGMYTPSETDAPMQETTEAITIDNSSGWDTFKDGIYDFVDAVQDINKKGATNSITDRTISVAYSDTVGSEPAKPVGPGQKLMKQYEVSLKTKDGKEIKDISNGENLYQSKFRRSFDSTKDALYGAVDSITGRKKRKISSNIPNSLEGYKLVAKPSMNKDSEVQVLSAYAAELKSKNPLTRLKAKFAVYRERRRQQRLVANAKMKTAIDGLKQILFDFVDTIQALYDNLLKFPSDVEKGMENMQSAVDGGITQSQQALVEIKKTPQLLQQAIEDTKKSVEETRRATMEVVQEVQSMPMKVQSTIQAIPTQVENSISETQKSINEKKEGVEQIIKGVENMTNEVKYMTGLAYRPKPPPPPKTTEDLAKDVAVGVAKGTASLAGKAGVAVAKGTAGMAISGAKMAWEAAKSSKGDKSKRPEPTTAAPPLAATTVTAPEAPKSIAEIDPLLEMEVAEALRVADEALSPPKITAETLVSAKDIDINEAVQRAKKAAAQAAEDAAELEAMLNERMTLKK